MGYAFFTTLLLPINSEIEGVSRSITIPYRASALFISLIVLMLNFHQPLIKNNSWPLKLLILFWGLLIVRILYDVLLVPEIYIEDKNQLFLYIFGICLLSMYSVAKSIRFINLIYSLYSIIILITITLIITLFSNEELLVSSQEVIDRKSGNLALNTIMFGHLATSLIVLCGFTVMKFRMKIHIKIIFIILILLGLFVMLRAGSRGPFIALFLIIYFFLFSITKYRLIGAFVLIIVVFLTFLFINDILGLVGRISPVIQTRLENTIYEGEYGGRDNLFSEALNIFYENPMLGKQFAFITEDGRYINSHNIVLDALMGLGIFGGIILISILISGIKKAYNLVKSHNPHFWIALLLIQQIVSGMSSGAFYQDQLLSVLLVYIFLHPQQKQSISVNN